MVRTHLRQPLGEPSGSPLDSVRISSYPNRMPGVQTSDQRQEYVAICKAPLHDKRLSWEARGIITFLLSQPPGNHFSVEDLAEHGPCKEHKTKRILNELVDHGYATKQQDGRGYTVVVYEAHESPTATARNEKAEEDAKQGSEGNEQKWNEDDFEYRVAKRFYERLTTLPSLSEGVKANIEATMDERIQRGATAVDRLVRLDDKSKAEVVDLIRYLFEEDYKRSGFTWLVNAIMSLGKLREWQDDEKTMRYFDYIQNQMDQSKPSFNWSDDFSKEEVKKAVSTYEQISSDQFKKYGENSYGEPLYKFTGNAPQQ